MSSQASHHFLARALELLPALGEDLERAQRELPPLVAIGHILAVVEQALGDSRIGRVPEAGTQLSLELNDVAAEIAALWGPRGDWVALVMRLDDAGERAALRAVSAPICWRGADRMAWEPMEDADLVALVARASSSGWLDALAAYPPLGLWASCLACASLLREVEPEARLTLGRQPPHAQLAEQGAHRALVLAALARLRAALEVGFPGLAARMQSTTPAARTAAAGPYRAHSPSIESANAEREPTVAEGAADPFAAALDQAGVAELLEEATVHGLRATLLNRATARIDDQQRSIFRNGKAKATEQRATAECAALPTVRARGVLRVLECGFFPIALHEAVVELHSAAYALMADTVFLGDPIVAGLSRCTKALDATRALLGLQLGLAGDESQLAASVAGHLAHATPRAAENRFEELVHDLATVLEGTTFARLHASLFPLAQDIEDADRGAAAADARVPWYERIRILGGTPRTAERDAHQREAGSARRNLAVTVGAVRGYLEGGLGTRHPQALAYYRTFDLRAALGNVHVLDVATISSRDTVPELDGDRVFRDYLETWTGELVRAFPDVQSPGEALDRYAQRRLDRARHGG